MVLRPLKGYRTFSTAFEKGNRFVSGPLVLSVVYHPADTVVDGHIGFGVTVSRRKARTAVMRNRIRRLLREAIRASVARYEGPCRDSRIATIVAVWRSTPAAPMLLRLHHVQPIVDTLLQRALAACMDVPTTPQHPPS